MQKSLFCLKKFQMSAGLPDFSSQGPLVWVLYNFLSSLNDSKYKTIISDYSTKETSYRSREIMSGTVREVYLKDQSERVFNFQFSKDFS